MHRSEGRFLTTHVGSLPRSPQLLAMLLAKEQRANADEAAFRHQIEHDLEGGGLPPIQGWHRYRR